MLNNEKLGFTVLLLSSLQLLLTLPSGAGRSAEPNANDAEEGAKRLLQGTTKDQPSPKIAESRLGTKKLLVVRVSSAVGESPDDSLDSIEGAIFGTGPNPDKVPREATVTAQYRAVTHNQLIYEPVAAGPNMTRAGLLEIQIELSMMDHSDTYERFDSIVQPAMMAKAVEAVGPLPDVADRVMFCLPTGSLKAGIAAIGDVGGMFTYYHYSSCTNLNIMMHELGHNLNFYHSNVGKNEYADESCYMGGPQYVDHSFLRVILRWATFNFRKDPYDGFGFPRKAFNGHKHWISGWFKNRTLEVDPSTNGSMCARLVGFVDYGNAAMLEHDVVLIRSGPLFLQYNRAKDYNIDNPVADRVTITEAYSDDSFSYSLAALAQGESYSYPNFDEAGNSLVVEVCTMFKEPLGVLDFADISIFVNDGKRESSCPPDTGHKSASQVSADKGLKFSDPVRTGLFIGLMCTFVLIMCTCLNLFCVVCSRKCGKPGSDSTKSVNDGEGLEDSAVIIDKNATECPRTSITPFKAVTITV